MVPAAPSPGRVPLPGGAYPSSRPAVRRPLPPGRGIISSAVIILSAVLFCLAAYIGVVSSLHHARAQHTAYADFRRELAEATAPVGPTVPDDPTKLLARTEQPFLRPQLPWETTGQYAAGTTFMEGLSYFRGKLFLYYGAADTFVGVAVADPPRWALGRSERA